VGDWAQGPSTAVEAKAVDFSPNVDEYRSVFAGSDTGVLDTVHSGRILVYSGGSIWNVSFSLLVAWM